MSTCLLPAWTELEQMRPDVEFDTLTETIFRNRDIRATHLTTTTQIV